MSNINELDQLIPSEEAIDSNKKKIYNEMYDQMFQPMFQFEPVAYKPTPLIIRTNNHRDYRVYFKADTYLTAPYLNALCHFLDSRSSEDTVTLILGVKTEDVQIHMLGSVLSAMMSCQAEITTVAAGYCSFFETALWCYGKQRKVLRYGALSFGKSEFISICPKYEEYFDTIYQRAQEIGIITLDDVNTIKETGREKMITFPNAQ